MPTSIEIIQQLIPSLMIDNHLPQSEFVDKYYQLYLQAYPSNNSMNGRIFEELIAMTLVRTGILPFYMQAKVAFIPNVDYDFIIYCKGQGPIVLSAKTSLRERYKQADLEAVALKYVHRKSESYIISLNQTEVDVRKRNLDDVMAIDDFVYAGGNGYDRLLDYLSAKAAIISPIIPIVSSNVMIDVENYYHRWQIE
ncbi:MAG: hypothetical protein WBC91_07975 [Phototrophicaceae bacterium]